MLCVLLCCLPRGMELGGEREKRGREETDGETEGEGRGYLYSSAITIKGAEHSYPCTYVHMQ